jgi:hypothetical protein
MAKRRFHKILSPIVKAYSDLAFLVRAAWTAEMRN